MTIFKTTIQQQYLYCCLNYKNKLRLNVLIVHVILKLYLKYLVHCLNVCFILVSSLNILMDKSLLEN